MEREVVPSAGRAGCSTFHACVFDGFHPHASEKRGAPAPNARLPPCPRLCRRPSPRKLHLRSGVAAGIRSGRPGRPPQRWAAVNSSTLPMVVRTVGRSACAAMNGAAVASATAVDERTAQRVDEVGIGREAQLVSVSAGDATRRWAALRQRPTPHRVGALERRHVPEEGESVGCGRRHSCRRRRRPLP